MKSLGLGKNPTKGEITRVLIWDSKPLSQKEVAQAQALGFAPGTRPYPLAKLKAKKGSTKLKPWQYQALFKVSDLETQGDFFEKPVEHFDPRALLYLNLGASSKSRSRKSGLKEGGDEHNCVVRTSEVALISEAKIYKNNGFPYTQFFQSRLRDLDSQERPPLFRTDLKKRKIEESPPEISNDLLLPEDTQKFFQKVCSNPEKFEIYPLKEGFAVFPK